MGFKQTDLVPPGSIGVTTTTPPSKDVREEIFQVTRTDTTAVLKDVLPADASILNLVFYGSVASNAGTSASITFNISNNTGVISTGTVNAITAGAIFSAVQMTGLPNIEQLPLQGDLKITAQYAETGTASTLGGPWVIGVRFVR